MATSLYCPPKYLNAGYPSSAIIKSIILPRMLSSMFFPPIKKPSIFCNVKACHRQMFSGLPQECEGMCACTYLFGVSYRRHGINSNIFLDSSNCFTHLWKNSLLISLVLKISFSSHQRFSYRYINNPVLLVTCNCEHVMFKHANWVLNTVWLVISHLKYSRPWCKLSRSKFSTENGRKITHWRLLQRNWPWPVSICIHISRNWFYF